VKIVTGEMNGSRYEMENERAYGMKGAGETRGERGEMVEEKAI